MTAVARPNALPPRPIVGGRDDFLDEARMLFGDEAAKDVADRIAAQDQEEDEELVHGLLRLMGPRPV